MFLYEVSDIGVITSETHGIRPRTQRGAPLPTAGIEKHDVASGHFHTLQLLQGLEIFPMDGRSRIEPPLGSGFSRQTRRIEQDGSGDNAVLQSIDIPFRATALGLDVLHRPAVVALAVHHDVTVHCIQMAVNDAMIRPRISICIGGSCRTDVAENTLQDVRCIRSFSLNDIVRQ